MNGCLDGICVLYVGSELGMEVRKRVVMIVKMVKNSLWVCVLLCLYDYFIFIF